MICSNARRTVDFYTKILGLKLVKKTVNYDASDTYHIYFGDETGRPGTLLTFFEWPDAGQGCWGIGTTHHLALTVETEEAQLKWKRWLTDHNIQVTGPYNRVYFKSLYFTDPDGLILEIATRKPGWTIDESPDQLGRNVIHPPEIVTHRGRNEEEIAAITWKEPLAALTPDMKLNGLHHITAISSDILRTTEFYESMLGFKVVKRTFNYDDTASPHFYYAVGDLSPGTVITYFGYSPQSMRYGKLGIGLTHHFAFAVASDEAQVEWRERLVSQNVMTTEILDRKYFKSIYFRDPDGHILEIATIGPGFLVDEDEESLGTALSLPSRLEPHRKQIADQLTPI